MPRAARLEGYSRRHRFTQRGAFGPVIRGSRKVRGQVCLLHVLPGTPGAARFGVALTRRTVPLSVARNRIKRVARETFRRHAIRHAGLDLVLMLRGKLPEGGEGLFREELARLLDQAAEPSKALSAA